MLKALEIAGFKSFADRTRFEFPDGITVIVGPNGSGKSNVVDAIKWVLGEQSVKSLRGKEMADVIFKGGGGRKALNTAEATLVIENDDGRLPFEKGEVHVTRRVYRSGEGEYLINNEPCRLKDIKDMFRGTGVGADAYSIIEQGKVDRMLQASTKDRRAIFEEAAGISRFKAKKLEAQRRLERVDQNLLRLSDIVDEVESRLRSVRNQAGKAKRYREYSQRLQELRTQIGLTDWRRMSQQLTELEEQLADIEQQRTKIAEELSVHDARVAGIESEIEEIDESMRTSEARFSRVRESISGRESNTAHLRERARELEEEQKRHRHETRLLTKRASELNKLFHQTQSQLIDAEASHEQVRIDNERHEADLQQVLEELDHRQQENEQRRAEHVQQMRALAEFGNQVTSQQLELAQADETFKRHETQLSLLQKQHERQNGELAELNSVREQAEAAHQEKTIALNEAQGELTESRRDQIVYQEELTKLRELLGGATQRIDLLEELEKRFEGLTAGVKEVMSRARQEQDGPFGAVRGLVADIIDVQVENAPLVDLALGDRAQLVVLSDDRLIEAIRTGEYAVPGRAGFICMPSPVGETQAIDLSGEPSVVGRLDRMARTTADCEPLLRRLLGDTWLVKDLSHALELSRSIGSGLRFITVGGQLVEPDGSMVVGPRQRTVGLISRKSELRALKLEMEEHQDRIGVVEGELKTISRSIEKRDSLAAKLADEQRTAADLLTDAKVRAEAASDLLQSLKEQRDAAEQEVGIATTLRETLTGALTNSTASLAKVEKGIAELEELTSEDDRDIETLQVKKDELDREITATKVAVAKSEQQVETLRSERARLEEDQNERLRVMARMTEQTNEQEGRYLAGQREILQLTSQLAEMYLLKDGLAETSKDLLSQRREVAQEKAAITRGQQAAAQQLRQFDEQQHRAEMTANELRLERTTMAERLLEDYGIEIANLEEVESPEQEAEREETEAEINTLRQKINKIGAVNMAALAELEELEERFAKLSGQYQDLVGAKESLERIIQRINADSRRLFAETLEAIRGNFQTLYRRSFGGGQADLVLEPGVDILESGIDIVARPPGKPEFNNSLLSGGEKALTAVSLLMGIFQFRPSPFCVLDEVDAPFDEANIGRFVDVLRDFLGWTKFIVVTHSKKTMTAGNTLYGVTMQESGVSKKVSVRFDDVSEDGHISAAAVEREDDAA